MSFIIKYFTCKEKSGAVTKVKLVTKIEKYNQLYFGVVVLTSYCSEAVVQRCSVKKVFLEISQNSQVFSCEFCEISKNTFFHRTPLVAASDNT